MYQSLAVFQTAAQMAKHAGSRQAVTAQNIANADTPGYRAKHIPAFKELVNDQGAAAMRATREGHLGQPDQQVRYRMTETDAAASPNGNAVSLEEEMMNSVQIAREHNRALSVYRHAMTVLKTTIGR